MKESYELIEVRGTEETIDFIQLAIHFEEGNEIVSTFVSCPLMSSLDVDSDEDILIHSALNAIGAGDLRKMRKEAKEQFNEITHSVIHFSKRTNEVEKVYIQLALIEMNLWSDVRDYISTTKEKERVYFESSRMWKKTNPAVQSAMSNLTSKQIDDVFERAHQLQKESNIRDVFE